MLSAPWMAQNPRKQKGQGKLSANGRLYATLPERIKRACV